MDSLVLLMAANCNVRYEMMKSMKKKEKKPCEMRSCNLVKPLLVYDVFAHSKISWQKEKERMRLISDIVNNYETSTKKKKKETRTHIFSLKIVNHWMKVIRVILQLFMALVEWEKKRDPLYATTKLRCKYHYWLHLFCINFVEHCRKCIMENGPLGDGHEIPLFRAKPKNKKNIVNHGDFNCWCRQ